MQSGSEVKISPSTPTQSTKTARKAAKRPPTLTEIELYSFSPSRLEPSRRKEVAEYVANNFLRGDGEERRKQADTVLYQKIAASLAR